MIQITVLAENTARTPDLEAEHGLSLLIETDTRRILFDMGQSDLFLRNARRLEIDLSTVDTAILSHGHYDHGGGLSAFLACNKTAPVYITPTAFEPHFNEKGKSIGLDPALQGNPRLILTGDECSLGDGMTLYTCNKNAPVTHGTQGMQTLRGNEKIADDFSHEQYLLIQEGEKKILVSGCSHKGVENLVEWFRPTVLIGGFHVSKLPLDEDLAAIARRLGEYGTEYFTFHCTGVTQYEFMKQQIPALSYKAGGDTITIF